MHRSSTIYKWKQSKIFLNKYAGGFWCERKTGDALFHWRKHHGLWTFWPEVTFEVKNALMDFFLQTCSFSLYKMLTDGLEWCGLLVDYCDVFISCLDSHSDGTHSLQRIHWWASDVMVNYTICSDEQTSSSTSWMAWGWGHFHLTFFNMCWPDGE